jgi:hypothetical protein
VQGRLIAATPSTLQFTARNLAQLAQTFCAITIKRTGFTLWL